MPAPDLTYTPSEGLTVPVEDDVAEDVEEDDEDETDPLTDRKSDLMYPLLPE